nr:hypothetical protein [Tanacetum cinerariifolium]
MAAGSINHPPMLAMRRYAQWQSRFLRYIDTRPNGDTLRKCILEGPYKLTTVIIPAVPATDDTPAIAHEIWIAIERLQQGESLNIQDVNTNLFWEFRKFTSHDGESMESYYFRFYKMVNEMIRNNLTVATILMAKIQEVPTIDSGTHTEPLEQVQNDAEYNVFANVRHHYEQPESTSNRCLVEKDDSNVTPDSSDMCDNDIQTNQNAEDELVALANLIANLKLDVDENKKIQKQLKRENTSLTHELKECKSILVKTNRTLRESNSIRDSCLIALQDK